MKKILLTLLLALSMVTSYASHYMGGEITWQCLANGKYTFHMKLYRECYSTTPGSSAATFGATEVLQTTYGPIPNITMTLKTGWPKDISPKCFSVPLSIKCPGMTNGVANMGALQEYYYTSEGSYPTGVQLNGVPPAVGWMFYHTSCCRNPSTNIVNSSNLGWRLRAIMYPYNVTNAFPCFDNSPTFAEIPRTVICSGYPFRYNHLAIDKELDSLSYAWGQPLLENGTPISTYAAGYSYLVPLPSAVQNVNNVAANINVYNGEIAFTSFTTGAFVTSTKVTAFRCGVKVAEIWRDMQVVLLPCGSNTPPIVTAPFPGNQYSKTVYAGDTVCFSMSATDFQFNPGSVPQYVELQASGLQFGSVSAGTPPVMSNLVGCLNPPCATLTPAPNPPTQPLKAQFATSTQFCWITTCAHVKGTAGCGVTSNIYNFVIKAMDDYCPAPAITIATITIKVLAKPTVEMPKVRCVDVLSDGKISLSWSRPIDTTNSFLKYMIYRSINQNGPFTLIDSVSNVNQLSWIDNNINGNNQKVYYYIQTKSGCFQDLLSSTDTVSSIHLDVTNIGMNVGELKWNHINNPKPISNDIYKVYRKLQNSWSLIGTTIDTIYHDTVNVCSAVVTYRVEIEDTIANCISKSNLDSILYEDKVAPNSIEIDSVSIKLSNKTIILNWFPSSSPDATWYIVWKLVGLNYVAIDTVDILSYNDTLVDACEDYYLYKISVLDSCFNQSTLSLDQSSLLLTTLVNVDDVKLDWNLYLNNDITKYEVWYVTSPDSLVATLNTNGYLNENLKDGIEHCYYIIATNDDRSRTSTSCVKCEMIYKQKMFIPNTFTPGGLNPIFKPVSTMIQSEGYLFTIYDRFGNKIFETTDVDVGWDGKYKNEYCQLGVYAYSLTFKTLTGETFNKVGTVTLLK